MDLGQRVLSAIVLSFLCSANKFSFIFLFIFHFNILLLCCPVASSDIFFENQIDLMNLATSIQSDASFKKKKVSHGPIEVEVKNSLANSGPL